MAVYTQITTIISHVFIGLAVLWGVIGLSGMRSWAHDNDYNRATLQGLESMEVLVHLQTEGVQQLRLTKDQLQTDVELQLRQAGIRVLQTSIFPRVILYVKVFVIPVYKVPLYAFSISIEVMQDVQLQRDLSTGLLASTWDTRLTGSVGADNLHTLRGNEGVRMLVDKFINAYLSVNPRPVSRPPPSSAPSRRNLVR